MTVDDGIRAAFEALADRAPHPGRVQQGLARAARAHRQRRALLLAGGAAAVVGGTIVATRGIFVGTGPAPAVTTTPAPTTVDPVTGNLKVPMRYRPRFLPESLREAVRGASLTGDADQYRAWKDQAPDWSPARQRLELTAYPWQGEGSTAGDVADVNGVRAHVGEDYDGGSYVTWRFADAVGLRVVAFGFADSRRTALDVAASVERDDVAALEVPHFLRWYPTGTPVTQYYRCAPGEWPRALQLRMGELTVGEIEFQPVMPPLYQAEPITVQGMPAVWNRTDQHVHIVVTAPDGRYLNVQLARGSIEGNLYIQGNVNHRRGTIPLTDDDAARVVAEMHIGPAPANEWYLTR